MPGHCKRPGAALMDQRIGFRFDGIALTPSCDQKGFPSDCCCLNEDSLASGGRRAGLSDSRGARPRPAPPS